MKIFLQTALDARSALGMIGGLCGSDESERPFDFGAPKSPAFSGGLGSFTPSCSRERQYTSISPFTALRLLASLERWKRGCMDHS